MKLTPKVLLEGTRLTGKTDLALALNRHPRFVGPRKYEYPSPLVSGEWCGFSNVPWGRGLLSYTPEQETRALETYRTWARLFELLPFYTWIVDRFHLSTMSFQIAVGRPAPDFGWLEARLRPLGFRIVLCSRRPESFAAARERRLQVSGNPSQYDDLTTFLAEQERVHALAAAPRLRSILRRRPAAADRVVDWLAAICTARLGDCHGEAILRPERPVAASGPPTLSVSSACEVRSRQPSSSLVLESAGAAASRRAWRGAVRLPLRSRLRPRPPDGRRGRGRELLAEGASLRRPAARFR
jgi:hypothetical protein